MKISIIFTKKNNWDLCYLWSSIFIKWERVTFARASILHEGTLLQATLLHDCHFSTRGHFCTASLLQGGSLLHEGTLLLGDSFALRVTFARSSLLHAGYFFTTSFSHGNIFTRKNFFTTLCLHGDIFAKVHFRTALYFHGYTYEVHKF